MAAPSSLSPGTTALEIEISIIQESTLRASTRLLGTDLEDFLAASLESFHYE